MISKGFLEEEALLERNLEGRACLCGVGGVRSWSSGHLRETITNQQSGRLEKNVRMFLFQLSHPRGTAYTVLHAGLPHAGHPVPALSNAPLAPVLP